MKPSAFRATLATVPRGRATLVVGLALLSSGCGAMKAYEGPELAKSEISVIDRRHSHSWMLGFFGVLPIPMSARHTTAVLEVDGKKGPGYEFHVRPGQHTATVAYTDNNPVNLCGQFGCLFTYRAILTVRFATEAGHEYRIPAERRGERDWIWVEDKTTANVIAGEKPPATPAE